MNSPPRTPSAADLASLAAARCCQPGDCPPGYRLNPRADASWPPPRLLAAVVWRVAGDGNQRTWRRASRRPARFLRGERAGRPRPSMMDLRADHRTAAGSGVRMATGNLGSPSRVRCEPMTSVSFNSLTVSPPAPTLLLGEVGGVGSGGQATRDGRPRVACLQCLGVTGPSVSRVGAVDRVSNRRDHRWSSVAVARVASNGLGLRCSGCDRHSPFRCWVASARALRATSARQAPRGPKPTWRVAIGRHVLPNGSKLRPSREGVKSSAGRHPRAVRLWSGRQRR